MIRTRDAEGVKMTSADTNTINQEITVLCVDSDEDTRAALEQAIERARLPLRLAGQAKAATDAIDLSLRLQPDIVVLDLEMPSLTDAPLGRQLQGLLDRNPLFICVAGNPSFEHARLAVQMGAVDLLAKPFATEELDQALQKAVSTLRCIRIHERERQVLERLIGQPPFQTSPAAAHRARTRSFQIAQAVRRYVDAHYHEDISLQTAADHVRLSASYLGPLFKAVCGVSFRTYLRMVRVAKAKELMRDPSLNLSEIAQRVGFEDENYFSQVFLEVTGMRPGQYRNTRLSAP
ncbi:MAG: response regulator transcription factor [Armatimonadota bacterium]|jgi:YesN/AraC family two-component response regulator